jgi:glycosyltransferase involved in cell wall biosynthesis
MKICHAFTRMLEDEGGGLVRSLFTLVHGLADRGHEVTLATASDSEFPGLWAAGGYDGLTIAPLPPPTRGLELFRRDALRRLQELFLAADIIHLHGMWRLSAHQMAALARRLDRPYVLTVHGRLDDWCMRRRGMHKRLFHLLFERRNLAAAGRVHVTADAEAEQASRWIPHRRISVIPYLTDGEGLRYSPDPEIFLRRHPEIDRTTPSVLYLSRLHEKKGPDILIDAIGMLRRRGVRCRLLIAGSGDPAYVEALRARAAERAPDAVFLGLVSGREKYSLFAFADLLALPTSQENFGLVITEALSQGTAVVTTRGTDIWPEVETGGGALLVERDAAAFADGIELLLRDRERRRAMGIAGRRWVRQWLDPDELLGRYEQMYREAVTRHDHRM